MRRVLFLALLVLSLGCEQPPPEQSEAPEPEEPVQRPAEFREDTLWIEGLAHPVELRLFEPQQPFPRPFWTYVPPTWEVEEYPDEKTVVFTPVEPLSEEALLSIRLYPAGMTQEDARERLRIRISSEARATQQTPVVVDQPERQWAILEIAYADGPVFGSAALTAYRGRFVEVFARYPVAAGDGFAPREQVVLENWQWADTGRPLEYPTEEDFPESASPTPPN